MKNSITACNEFVFHIKMRRYVEGGLPRSHEEHWYIHGDRTTHRLPMRHHGFRLASRLLVLSRFLRVPTRIGPEWTSLHDCTSWPFCPQDGLCFSSTSSPYINQHSTTVNVFACWPLTFFLGAHFFPTLTLHTTLPPSYPINLPTLLTYLLAYTLNPTN
jgi:hypothetical protein